MTLKLPEEDVEFQIAKLDMRQGDVLVARAMRIIPSEAAARIRAYLERAMPGTKVVVIDGSLELSVVSKADAKKLEGTAK
jgi:hypothetical protein